MGQIKKLTNFSEFSDELPFIIIILSMQGDVLLWNKKAEEITGYFSRDIRDLRQVPFLEKLFDGQGTFGNSKKIHKPFKNKETELLTKSGEVKTIVWDGITVRIDNNDKTGSKKVFLITGKDVTDFRMYESKLSQKEHYIDVARGRLKKYLSLDPHTGTLNYRHFINIVNDKFYASIDQKKPISLLLLDINYLHSINNTYRVSSGNKVIKEVAQLLKDSLNPSFTVARFSGKEFAVLMPDTDVDMAWRIARELFEKFKDHKFKVKRDAHLNIDVNIAVGGWPYCEDVFTPDQLIDRTVDCLAECRHSCKYSVKLCLKSRYFGERIKADDDAFVYDDSFRYTMEFVNALANTVKIKDFYTQEHSAIMANYSVSIADYMGVEEHEIQSIRMGAMLHDIGKIGIDKLILLKPSALSEEEYAIIKQHPLIGAEIIRNVHPLKDVVPLVLYHHERYDGEGYLNGLRGDEIPLGARVISLADIFQALTSDRPYRKALSEKETFDVIKKYSGKYFDPKIVKAFFEVYRA